MAKKEALTVTVKGPLFKSDAPRELIEAANTGLLDLVQLEGANKTGQLLKQGRGRRTGTLQRSIFGGASLKSDLHAQYDAGEASMGQNRVYATWIEGISPRNQTSRFKGYGMFKETSEAIAKDNKIVDKYIGEAITRAFA